MKSTYWSRPPRGSNPADRPSRLRRPLGTLLFIAAHVGPVHAANEGPNLVVNGNFNQNLSGWVEESHSNFTSNWSGAANFGAPPNGVLVGEGKSPDEPLYHEIAWQCIDVRPGRHYVFRAAMTNAAGDEDDLSGGNVMLRSAAHGGCAPEPGGQTLAWFDYNERVGTEWVPYQKHVRIPEGVSRVHVSTRADSGGHWGGSAVIDSSNMVWYDAIALRELQGDLRPAFVDVPASVVPEVPFQFTIEMINESEHPAYPTDMTINHQGQLTLLSWSCPGAVVDVTQGTGGHLLWFDHAPLAGLSRYTCVIEAEAKRTFHGSLSLVAATHSDNEGDSSDTIAFANIEVGTAPDVDVAVEVTEFPQAGQSVQALLTLRNTGSGSAGPVIVFDWRDTSGSTVELGGFTTTCGQFSYAGGSAAANVALAAGATMNCTLGFTWPAGQSGDLLGHLAATNVPNDLDPSNNSAEDIAQLLRLRVNGWQDAPDSNPGDGICDINTGQPAPICTLRAAVMEANAIPGIQTIELPVLPQDSQLTRGTAAGSDSGAINITQGVRIVGEPLDGARPRLRLNFPAPQAHKALRISTGGYVRLENFEIVGQRRDNSGNGGLVEKTGGGTLELRDMLLQDGHAMAGGAIWASGDVDLIRTSLIDNAAVTGGGLYYQPAGAGFLTIVDSRISANKAAPGYGGGVWMTQGLVLVDGTTLDDNDAQRGGGLYIAAGNHLAYVVNSTLTGNTAALEGGGLWAASGTLLLSSTIADNAAAPGDDGAGLGGGVYVDAAAQVVTRGSIWVGNTAQIRSTGGPWGFPHAAVCWGELESDGYNSVQSVSFDELCDLTAETGDMLGTFATLGPLADNGGPTPTRALESNGNEVDLGEPDCTFQNGAAPMNVDQRGHLRPADGDGDGIARCDKGAYERSDAARVTVQPGGAGQGFVSSSPAGIFCGATCSVAFEAGATVTLNASSSFGSRFVGWGGACAAFGTAASCTVSANGTVLAEAIFQPANSRNLDVRVVGSGTGTVTSTPVGIACPGDCSEAFDDGAAVMLAAEPAAGSTFIGWNGGYCGGSGECSLEMTGPRQVEAVFATSTWQLQVGIGGDGHGTVDSSDGSISCPSICVAELPDQTQLELLAVPAPGSTFVRWAGGACDSSSDVLCALTLDADQLSTALFATEVDPELGVEVVGGGTLTSQPAGVDCSSDCSAAFPRGTVVTLTATAAPGHEFVGWRAGPCLGSASPQCTLTLEFSTLARAQFAVAGQAVEAIFGDGFEP